MSNLKGKKLAELFFSKPPTVGKIWTCEECRKDVRQTGSGYSNLCTHINVHHSHLITIKSQKNADERNQIFSAFRWSPKTLQIHGWLHFIIMGLQPFSSCENPVFREHIKHSSLSRNTLMKYLSLLTSEVESLISAKLPDSFAIVFDGWSNGDTHYVSIFATYPYSCPLGYSKILLAMSPLGAEDNFSADAHYDLIKFVVTIVFGKSMECIVAIIGDNCNTNRALGRHFNAHFVGCYSHRFNLAVKDVLTNNTLTIEKVQKIMKKLSCQLPAAKLRRFTHLKAKQNNVTRWSSTYDMLKRYVELREFLTLLDIPDIFLSSREDAEVNSVLVTLSDLDSITKELQKESTTMCEARTLFDGVLSEFPEMENRLSATSNIIENKVFEAAIIKIQDGRQADLTAREAQTVSHLQQQESEAPQVGSSTTMSFAEKILKSQRNEASIDVSTYMDLRFIVCTSNLCERFFSTAGYTLNDRRMRISPAHFEAQLFLHVNGHMWGLAEVDKLFS